MYNLLVLCILSWAECSSSTSEDVFVLPHSVYSMGWLGFGGRMNWVDTFPDAIDVSFTNAGYQYGIGEATVLGCRTFVAASLNSTSF